tara:strand:+ start:1106 stop:2053 length:948 start_codon:yes stop_codon:yes gene_type:complete
MKRLNIVFLDRATFGNDCKIKKPNFPHNWIEHQLTKKSQVFNRVKDADIVITNKVILKNEYLKKLKKLKFISIPSTGTNIIDLMYCKKLGIKVSNIRNYANDSVAEHVLGLIIYLTKKIGLVNDDIKKGKWLKRKTFGAFLRTIPILKGKKIGIIGKGSTGKALAKISRGFGMKVTFFSARKFKEIEFIKFLSYQDILSIHCPLADNTKNLITMKHIKKMKKNIILINSARGSIINEKDLVTAIQNNLIGGAGVDVVSKEPPPANHPYFKIISKPNFILTPHTAFATTESLQLGMDMTIENINCFYKGRLIRRVA